ncbi:TPA: NAD-dependent epimerase/dehydratase family protein [Legionella pneumophila]|nr:NAD-dependent epimerase/dehydratase family protein [Legionella pneumophila]HEO1403327.1 NAD-dependent epimerase/dehydratase family protein [Legionella pneumophila]
MKKALVTGGMGFIGNHLVKHLLSLGVEVLLLDKSVHKPTYYDIHEATIIEGDVLSHELLHNCLKSVDTCFHLAALSSVAICNRDWIFSHENNVLAFNGLLEELRRIKHPVKLVYASSAAVYGDSEHLPLSESEHVLPNSTYGADKLSNEIYAEVVRKIYGIPSIGLRLFNVYGPGQLASNRYSNVITIFKQAIETEQPLIIYGDGNQIRDFIYINDVIRAFMLAAQTPIEKSGVFNVCSNQSISILELAELMMCLSMKKLPIIYKPKRTGDLTHSVGDGSLAKKELSFSPSVSMKEGLMNFLRENNFKY